MATAVSSKMRSSRKFLDVEEKKKVIEDIESGRAMRKLQVNMELENHKFTNC